MPYALERLYSGWGSWRPGGALSQLPYGKPSLGIGSDTADLQRSSSPTAAASSRPSSADT
eukprot:4215169-Pyramimonas_sp.AAC.1